MFFSHFLKKLDFPCSSQACEAFIFKALQKLVIAYKTACSDFQGGVSATDQIDSSAGQTDATGREQELKSKLEKASVALNELHMTKADTEKELTNSKAKVRQLRRISHDAFSED